jgi:hypothetical protein
MSWCDRDDASGFKLGGAHPPSSWLHRPTAISAMQLAKAHSSARLAASNRRAAMAPALCRRTAVRALCSSSGQQDREEIQQESRRQVMLSMGAILAMATSSGSSVARADEDGALHLRHIVLGGSFQGGDEVAFASFLMATGPPSPCATPRPATSPMHARRISHAPCIDHKQPPPSHPTHPSCTMHE